MADLTPDEARGHAKVLHDDYRTAILNKCYYGHKLSFFSRVNVGFEILIAMGATGSTGAGIANLTIWTGPPGILAWAAVSGTAVVLSTLKPIINIGKQIERCGKLWGEYSRLV
jgi:hypothetical protein